MAYLYVVCRLHMRDVHISVVLDLLLRVSSPSVQQVASSDCIYLLIASSHGLTTFILRICSKHFHSNHAEVQYIEDKVKLDAHDIPEYVSLCCRVGRTVAPGSQSGNGAPSL